MVFVRARARLLCSFKALLFSLLRMMMMMMMILSSLEIIYLFSVRSKGRRENLFFVSKISSARDVDEKHKTLCNAWWWCFSRKKEVKIFLFFLCCKRTTTKSRRFEEDEDEDEDEDEVSLSIFFVVFF